jgi:hypothetical protein
MEEVGAGGPEEGGATCCGRFATLLINVEWLSLGVAGT